jgi:predicted DCC family thiol-disulfide oxidoreductase YuxK
MNQAGRQLVVMYFDGGCPLCRREVAHYQRIDRQQRVKWVDIDADATALQDIGVSHEAAMKRLHVTDHQGRLVTGAYAFKVLWQELPAYRWLAKLVSPAWLLTTLDKLYSVFANRRYKKRQRCKVSCER